MPAAEMAMVAPAGKVFARRWSGFVAASWLMAFSGTFAFSNFSSALKEVIGLNQKELNRLSVAKDLGDSMGVLVGILSNYLPLSALLCIGALIGVVGNGVQWLIVSRLIATPPYWAVFIVSVVQGFGMPWMNTSVFTLSVRNFPHNRGPVVGLFKGLMGLSAAIYSTISRTFFSSSPIVYLFMMMTVPPIFCLIMAAFCGDVPPSESAEDVKAEEDSLLAFNLIAGALAILIAVQNLVPDLSSVPVVQLVLLGLMFVLLAGQALVPVVNYFKIKREGQGGPLSLQKTVKEKGATENGRNSVEASRKTDRDEDGMREPLLVPAADTRSVEELSMAAGSHSDELSKASGSNDEEIGKLTCPSRGLEWASSLGLGEDWTTTSLLKTWHPYMLYWSLFCGAGTGVSFCNNLGQVGASFGFDAVTVFISLFSLGNFFGRIVPGNASEYFIKTMGTPRPGWLGLSKLLMIMAFAWLSTGSAISLYVGSLVVGFSHGTHVALCVATISELYGLKYFGTNYMVINTHLVVGSIVFSGGIAGYLYDKNGSYAEGKTTLTCYGASCYGTTFWIYVGFLTVAVLVDAFLSFISRPLYKKLQEINSLLPH